MFSSLRSHICKPFIKICPPTSPRQSSVRAASALVSPNFPRTTQCQKKMATALVLSWKPARGPEFRHSPRPNTLYMYEYTWSLDLFWRFLGTNNVSTFFSMILRRLARRSSNVKRSLFF